MVNEYGIKSFGKIAMVVETQKQSVAEKILNDAIKTIGQMSCLVGIPEATATRDAKDGKKANVNNAMLLFWHTKGSPLHGYPARPSVEPAIEASGNKEKISEDLGMVAEYVMKGDSIQAKKFLELAGQDAVNAIQAWWDDSRNGWAPDAPMTIKMKGSSQVLVDTGQLRRAINYVIRKDT
jgi:hypothetical protein